MGLFKTLIVALCILQSTTLSQAIVFPKSDSTPRTKATAELPDLYEASVIELQDGLDADLFTSVDLVKVHTLTCTH